MFRRSDPGVDTLTNVEKLKFPDTTVTLTKIPNDYNGDGKSDLLLRNDSTGMLWDYQMNGTAIAGGGLVDNPGTAWKVVGDGDYNGDGKADILLHNASTGMLWEYQMNGNTIAANGGVTSATVDWGGWWGEAATIGCRRPAAPPM